MNTSSAFTFRSVFLSKIEIYEIKFSVVKCCVSQLKENGWKYVDFYVMRSEK